jgi:hypothetical protein
MDGLGHRERSLAPRQESNNYLFVHFVNYRYTACATLASSGKAGFINAAQNCLFNEVSQTIPKQSVKQ